MSLVKWVILAAVVAVAPAAAAVAADSPPARPQANCRPEVVPGASGPVDLEVDPRCRVLVAPVSINGTAGRFVVATGTPHTLVSPDFAAKAGIAAGAVTASDGSKITHVESLKVGATEFKNFDVRIASLDAAAKQLERRPDGILGADVLLATPITLDCAKKSLTFARPPDLAAWKAVPAVLSFHRLMVQATFDGEPVGLMVDTAANPSYLVRCDWRGQTEKAGGHESALPKTVVLGGLDIGPMKPVLGEQCLLGLDLFNRSAVVLDAQEKKVYFPAGSFAPAKLIARTPEGTAQSQPGGAGAKAFPPKVEKQVSDLQAKLLALTEERFKVTAAVAQAEQKALETIKLTPDEIAEEFAKGMITNPLRTYRAAVTAGIPQLQAVSAKFAVLQKQVKMLKDDRQAADALPTLAAFEEQVHSARKIVGEQIADLTAKAGDFKTAIGLYQALLQAPPEARRAADLRSLKEKIAGACEKAHDYRNALTAYKEAFDSVPEPEHPMNIPLMLKVAQMYEKTDDLKSALQMFKHVQKDIPQGSSVANLDKKVEELEKKVDGAVPRTGPTPPQPRSR
jgi:tetratricopeptide (TPR) repeat protein